jgi:putative MATE family efflux protein
LQPLRNQAISRFIDLRIFCIIVFLSGDHVTEIVQKKRADYTEGSVFYSILKMGLPSMFGFLSQHIYSMVDMFWVSRLPHKEAGVAAITFFGSILWFFFSFNQLVGPGSVAIISRRYGEKEYDQTEKAIKETLILKLIFGVLFAAFGYTFAEDILRLVGAENEALTLGADYGRIMFVGMPIMYATYSIYTAMRGVANPHMAMILMLVSNALNLVLDPVFIFGYWGLPALGVKGAAYASVLSYALTFLIGLFLFYTGCTNVQLHLHRKEHFSLDSMRKIVKIGVPAWFGDMAFSGARLVITRMVAPFGTAVVAAYGVGNQVTAFGITLLVGIGLGLSSLIGHNLGADKSDRAKKTADQAVLLGVSVMFVFGLVVFVLAHDIMHLFFDADTTVAHGNIMLKIFAIGFPFIGAFIMMEEVLVGAGLNTPAMIMNIIHSWLLEAVPIYLLTNHLDFGETAIWWTISAASVITAFAFYTYYRRGRWLTVKV